uniref:Uncharacterized protein n=1 Tax=Nelumbo nucifera TaxID=4432 RepID=A0A822Z197_NELNU|nr:TPA_asm: hypothetical protein HUJ06_007866 [Nelumbo nucifera]
MISCKGGEPDSEEPRISPKDQYETTCIISQYKSLNEDNWGGKLGKLDLNFFTDVKRVIGDQMDGISLKQLTEISAVPWLLDQGHPILDHHHTNIHAHGVPWLHTKLNQLLRM